MTFRRGFKSEAERIALEKRSELNLKQVDPLCPLSLAKHLGIEVFEMRQLGAQGNTFVRFFSGIGQDEFSAVTVFNGLSRIIVHNESHHPNRQASNVAHEISHALLGHEPGAVVGVDGQRLWNAVAEAEASWLAGALLVPREGVLRLMGSGWSLDEVSLHYGVSLRLCEWRVRETGVLMQLKRARRFT